MRRGGAGRDGTFPWYAPNIGGMAFPPPQEHRTAAVDTLELRRAFGHFATGVTVVTYEAADGEFRGTTVNSFTSVSLDPPLVLVSLGRQTRAAAALRSGSAFAVNVLHHGQRDLAMHFAGRPKPETEVRWEMRDGRAAPGRVLLLLPVRRAGCARRGRSRDHRRARRGVPADGRAPLIFYRGAFERLDSPSATQPAPEVASHLFGDFPELW